MDLSLGFLFCSVDLYFCLCASTMLSWWLWLCSRAWSQTGWFFQFQSSFLKIALAIWGFFCISIQIVKLFVLVLWKISLVAWYGGEGNGNPLQYSCLENPMHQEPGRLQPMRLLGVGHNWATSLSLFTFTYWEGNGNSLQCSCLENPRDGRAWWAAVYGVAQSRTWLKWLGRSSSLIGIALNL